MSYEGYTEYLCEKGHYLVRDCYENDLTVCSKCKLPMAFYHIVDTTNGEQVDNLYTFAADKIENGFDDIERKDHYGNIYYNKLIKYLPVGKEWKTMNVPKGINVDY